MHIHILGICGTFMGGVALLAKAAGHRVTGSDANVYPPMSDQLREQGIELMEGYLPDHLQPAPDQVVVGNALSRGNPAIEYMLDQGLDYVSGPEWLARQVLRQQLVLAVAGTHGKTTTASMLAWLLDQGGLAPGFLIGGVPRNFGVSARAGAGRHFVVEADEYDCAFFDKRSKFVHYRPRVAILNNLEFDHADIFPDLSAIQRQFHHLVRTVPGNGLILAPAADTALREVLAMGRWTPLESLGAEAGWSARLLQDDGSRFEVRRQGRGVGEVNWSLIGAHNVSNALAAIAAAEFAGVAAEHSCQALGAFRNVRRRMELRGNVHGIAVYDDFAHHPSAIATTLDGLRRRVGDEPIVVVLEPRSNTMRLGVHRERLAGALRAADRVYVYEAAGLGWRPRETLAGLGDRLRVMDRTDAIIQDILQHTHSPANILVMSNGGFEGIHQRLLDALGAGEPPSTLI